MVSKSINANVSLVQSNDSEESSDDSKMIENSCNGTTEQFKNKKIIIVGDSLLNGINENDLSKNHSVKVNNILGGTSDAILKSKPDGLIVHAGMKVITKGKNILNNANKILKQLKKLSPNTKLAFLSIVIRKDKKL